MREDLSKELEEIISEQEQRLTSLLDDDDEAAEKLKATIQQIRRGEFLNVEAYRLCLAMNGNETFPIDKSGPDYQKALERARILVDRLYPL